MFTQLKLYILRFFAKDLDAILALFTKLDAQLDAYIARETQEAQALTQMASQLQREANEKTARIEKAGRVQANIAGLAR